MNFGDAIAALKDGKRVARAGWNGKGMWLLLIPAEQWDGWTAQTMGNVSSTLTRLPWIGMKTAGNEFVPWLASQTDVLAEDWGMVNA